VKTIIAGPRDQSLGEEHYELLHRCGITEVVSGGARGVDASGEMWALSNAIPMNLFPADWSKHGKAAGPIRNKEMAEYADQLVAFRGKNGMTRGTRNMVKIANFLGLKVIVFDL
jgi:hypothetical protein